MASPLNYTTFVDHRLLAGGDLKTVLTKTKAFLEQGGTERLLTFEDETGKQVDFDYTGTLEEVLNRALPSEKKKGPGRPKLGVVSVQVSLFPRHWEWLDEQPSGASATLRRLVEEARKQEPESARARRCLEATGRFLSSMAGDFAGYEEACRALYAGDWLKFIETTRTWPEDVRVHALTLARGAGAPLPTGIGAGMRVVGAGAGSDKPLWLMSATTLAGLIRRGEVSAVEVTESCLDRIHRTNPRWNAVTEILAEEARKGAREVDRRRAAGETLGPLAGVPFTVKGNIDIAGHATTHGIPAMSEAMAPLDAPPVERLRRAGALPIGHTNLPDLSLRFHTRSQLYGATVNPWNPTQSPGGSSGGEGVALATGMSALGLGNDAGGSLRIPALFSGVAALKPTCGRFPSDRSVGPRDLTLASQWIPVDGPLARTVEDLRAAFEVLAGSDPRDPRAVPCPVQGPSLKGPVRVALVTDPGGLGVHPDVRAALKSAALSLEEAGYVIEEVDAPRLNESVSACGRFIMTEFSMIRPMLERLLSEDSRRYIEFAMSMHKPMDLSEYIGLTALRSGLQRDWAEFLEKYPVLLGPVFREPSVPVDFDIRGMAEHAQVARGMGLCTATSFIGLPSVAVPTGIANGNPMGVQVVSSFYREDLCLEAASAIEARSDMKPPPGVAEA